MLIELDHHSGVPIYRQIIDQIRKSIMAGELGEGEQLETVRDMAGRLKVNPMTVSKAYSILEMEKLVERKRGVGLFVGQVDSPDVDSAKKEMIDEAMRQAAMTVMQLGGDEDEAIEMFREHFNKSKEKKRQKAEGSREGNGYAEAGLNRLAAKYVNHEKHENF